MRAIRFDVALLDGFRAVLEAGPDDPGAVAGASAHQMDGVDVWDRSWKGFGWKALLGSECGGPDVSPYAAPARATDLPAALISRVGVAGPSFLAGAGTGGCGMRQSFRSRAGTVEELAYWTNFRRSA